MGNRRELYIKRTISILILLASAALIYIFVLYISPNARPNSPYPKLDGHIEEIEALLGDYSDYYIVLDKKKNSLANSIASTDVTDTDYVFIAPQNINEKAVVLDFYTCWDEYIKSYICDFSNNKTYIVKGKNISLTKSDLQFVFLDVVPESLKKINSYVADEEAGKTPKKPKASVLISTDTYKGPITATAQIKPRGASSWHLYERKPYSLKLDATLDLFGLGADKKWNLLSNASDKTLLKNEMFFDLANSLELEYTPKIKNVNLYINKFYQGVYSVSTKVKQGKNTVNLKQGDYLFNIGSPYYDEKIDFECEFWAGNEDEFKYAELVYPESDILTGAYKEGSLHKKAQQIIQDFVDTVEKKNNKNLSDVIDLESFAKYYWVQEISMNSDAWYRSNYMYYKKDANKLFAGPVWDMEWTMGSTIDFNNGVEFKTPTGWKIRKSGYYTELFKNPEFVSAVDRVYYNYNIPKLMDNFCSSYIKKAQEIKEEGEINFTISKDENNYYNLDSTANDYESWVNERVNFMKIRKEWIKEQYQRAMLQ